MEDPRFQQDLYRGTARYYDRFRLAYPALLIADLKTRAELTGAGRLLDLGCGPGQISFSLHDCFDEVWAVDQEPDMVTACELKIEAGGYSHIRCVQSAAEDLSMPNGSCRLIGIGNAFHRFDRVRVASRCLEWLEPGGHLALLWGGTPWRGRDEWQLALSALIERWMTALNLHDRIPAGHEEARRQRPDLAVLVEVGFEVLGSWDFFEDHCWTSDDLAGFVYSTSLLSPEILGGRMEDFEEDLRRELHPHQSEGAVHQRIRFAYELARAPLPSPRVEQGSLHQL